MLNRQARNALVLHYRRLVDKWAWGLWKRGWFRWLGEIDDLLQETYLILIKTLDKLDVSLEREDLPRILYWRVIRRLCALSTGGLIHTPSRAWQNKHRKQSSYRHARIARCVSSLGTADLSLKEWLRRAANDTEEAEELLLTLPLHYQDLLCKRYGLRDEHPHTLEEIALGSNRTRQAVHIMLTKALRLLKGYLLERNMRGEE